MRLQLLKHACLGLFPSLCLIPDCSPEQGLTDTTNENTSLWKLCVTYCHYMAWLAQIATAEMTCICETACHGGEKSFPSSGELLTKSKRMGGGSRSQGRKYDVKTKPKIQIKQETLSNN